MYPYAEIFRWTTEFGGWEAASDGDETALSDRRPATPAEVVMEEVVFQVFANAADGTFITDRERRIVYWNPAAEEILGYSYDQAKARTCCRILRGRDDQGQPICREHCSVAATTLRSGAVASFDMFVQIRSGDRCWINISTFAIPANGDRASWIVHLFRDVTQNKLREQLLHEILKAAMELQGEDPSRAASKVQGDQPFTGLTNRECEVLRLLAQGLSTRDIARWLSISPTTTQNHIRNILRKLYVRSRLEAVVLAYRSGFVSEE
jgi:PAS domain S-box-containing protein